MSIGTRSLLFGVHQFLWHPLTVGYAWRKLLGVWPTWREWVCIFLHDVGYWGKPNIDGKEGRRHPEVGAILVDEWLGDQYYQLTLYHSREYAKMDKAEPSLLCWADKYSVLCDPEWFYLLRGWLSGEIREFKQNAPPEIRKLSDRQWLRWYRNKVLNMNEVRYFLSP